MNLLGSRSASGKTDSTLTKTVISDLSQRECWQTQLLTKQNLSPLKINLIFESETDGDLKFKNIKNGKTFTIQIAKNQKYHLFASHILLASDTSTYKVLNLNSASKSKERKFTTHSLIDSVVNYDPNAKLIHSQTREYKTKTNSDLVITIGESSKNTHLLLEEPCRNEDEEINNKIFTIRVFDVDFQKVLFEKKIETNTKDEVQNTERKIQVELIEDFLVIRETLRDKIKTYAENKFFLFDLNREKNILDISSNTHNYQLCPTLKLDYILQFPDKKTIDIFNIVKNSVVCRLNNFDFPTITNTLSLPPQFGYDHFLFVPKTDKGHTVSEVAIWDLEEGKCIDSIKHDPSEQILQIERIDNFFITISEKTIQVWDAIKKTHTHLTDLEKQKNYTPKHILGKYLVDINLPQKKISTWNITTSSNHVFEGLPLGSIVPKTAAIGNLLAVLMPPSSINKFYQHRLFTFDMEKGGDVLFSKDLITSEGSFDLKFLTNKMLVLSPTHDKPTKQLEVFKFEN